MIEFLRGRLVRRAPTEVVLEVGGVGFRITVPISTSSALSGRELGSTIELLIHTQVLVTDPQIRLFGFYKEAERRFFELLTSVKGVGPGMAVRVLSGAAVEELRDAIAMEDVIGLTKVKGIGKKTAQRIVFDLKEKVTLLGDLEGLDTNLLDSNKGEALVAMEALGYESREARKAVDTALKKLGEKASSEALVRQALQEIS